MSDETNRIEIDNDWKAEAQREKERLAEIDSQQTEKKTKQEVPEASFKSLIGMMASQAIMGLGAVADKKTGGVVIDLEGSKFAIDLLGVIEEKTKGNLDEEESAELNTLLSELRSRFVEITKLVAEQAAKGGATPMSATGATPTDSENNQNSGIIIP